MIHRMSNTEPARDDSEAWPASRFKPEHYRAAYWRAENRDNGGILLTRSEHCAVPTGMLVNIARHRAEKLGLRLAGGAIVIIGTDGQDELRDRV